MASGNNPSKAAKNGSTVAVASMSNAQLGSYYGNDTRVGASAVMGGPNGLLHRIADGRAGDLQDFEDAAYIRRTLFNSN